MLIKLFEEAYNLQRWSSFANCIAATVLVKKKK